jgi:hypothetical protein
MGGHHENPFPWPADAVEMLRKYFATGASASYIAERINAAFRCSITRNAVIGKMSRLGLERCPQEARRARASNGRKQGNAMSARTKAVRLGKAEQIAKPAWTPKDIAPAKPRHTHPVSTSAITGCIIPGPTPTAALPIPASVPRPDTQPVTIDQLIPSSCRWPIDPTPEHPEWRYCGCTRDAKSIRSPYCTAHWLRSLSGRRAA